MSIKKLLNSSFLALCAAETLAASLSEALSSGDEEEAVKLCQRLSQLCVPVSVSVSSQAYPQDSVRWGHMDTVYVCECRCVIQKPISFSACGEEFSSCSKSHVYF